MVLATGGCCRCAGEKQEALRFLSDKEVTGGMGKTSTRGRDYREKHPKTSFSAESYSLRTALQSMGRGLYGGKGSAYSSSRSTSSLNPKIPNLKVQKSKVPNMKTFLRKCRILR